MMSGSRLFIFLQDGDHSESWLWPILISLPVPGRPGFSVSKDVALEVSLSGGVLACLLPQLFIFLSLSFHFCKIWISVPTPHD